ncbi:MAG TPA: acetyl-CoA hydrolase/transferase C-terminal domain-containing protein, partial [Candidatus Obscuribacter sp.]|nr:acetyl-CoA hydrolase/transferase C-terminal domain-containing protein [Candidatus Obscuribacter sp.]HND67430.1 acetyl-CoA hydrolase/transferase C-terminal domain-containing protein [Candidatus Obscuribacter sp.]
MQGTLEKGDWRADYERKKCSAEEAVRVIQSGDHVYVHSNAAVPECLVDAMVGRASELRDVTVLHLLTLGKAEYAQEQYQDSFRVKALFIGKNIRDAVNEGRAEYMPIFLSEIPRLFESGTVPVDVCLIQVSPPDAHGFCSYGVSVDCTIAARKKARFVLAEVNKQMPRTLGRSFVHVSRLDRIVETDRPLPELIEEPCSEVEELIGLNVATLVEDEATIQLGIGTIPNAVLANLDEKRNLGVHSEMLSDNIVDLIEKGIVTNDAKTVLPGKVAVSFVLGTRRLYDFIDNNPMIEFQTSDFINDPFVISRNHKMTAINSALQVDITGQVAADSIGSYLYSGFGGQVDFIRGASRSPGGKAIIAMPSTARGGTVSRITTSLSPGSGVVTSRADVHYVVTEYGVAQLYGRSLKERT